MTYTHTHTHKFQYNNDKKGVANIFFFPFQFPWYTLWHTTHTKIEDIYILLHLQQTTSGRARGQKWGHTKYTEEQQKRSVQEI